MYILERVSTDEKQKIKKIFNGRKKLKAKEGKREKVRFNMAMKEKV